MNRILTMVLLTGFLAFSAMPAVASAQEMEAETDVDFGYYIEPFHYAGSDFKSNGFSAGLYTQLTYGRRHGLQTLINYKRIDFKGLENFRQWDYTAVYTHYRGQYHFRGGLHFASTNYVQTDGAVTFIAGLGRRVKNQWFAKIDGYYTYYNDGEPDLTTYQLSPRFGRYFFTTGDSRLLATIKGDYIHVDRDALFTRFLDDEDFYSGGLELTCEHNHWRLTGAGWAGEQVFAVVDDGFAVNNLNEKYTGGVAAEIAYVFDTGVRIAVGFDMDFYEEIFVNDEGSRRTYLVNFGSRF